MTRGTTDVATKPHEGGTQMDALLLTGSFALGLTISLAITTVIALVQITRWKRRGK